MRTFLRFPVITLISSSLLVLIAGLMFHFLVAYDDKDEQEYRQLLADTRSNEAEEQPYIAKQQHRYTRKDIWFISNGQRLQLRLISDDTDFVLDHQQDQTEIIEDMRQMQCYMQEEIYYLSPDGRELLPQADGRLLWRDNQLLYLGDIEGLKPMQIVRFMEAETASYYYKRGHLQAHDVQLSRYSIPGHVLLSNTDNLQPLMTGQATAVELSWQGKEGMNFTAHQLKAKMALPERNAS